MIERPDLRDDPALAHNDGRVSQVAMLDAAIGEWAAQRSLEAALDALNGARIPAGKIYDIADIAGDPHYRARDMILDAQLPDGTPVQLPGIVPKLSATPRRTAQPRPCAWPAYRRGAGRPWHRRGAARGIARGRDYLTRRPA